MGFHAGTLSSTAVPLERVKQHAQSCDDRCRTGAGVLPGCGKDDVDVNPGKGDDGVGKVKPGDQGDKDSGKKE